MAEFTLTKLLGGIANGHDVPGDWSLISEWEEPGTGNKTIYDKRSFFMGGDVFIVWVAFDIPEPEFQAIMRWHREMYRGDLVSAQKSLLHETISAAMNYSNVIMVVGYAGLFALWAQMTGQGVGKFTPLTSFFIALCLCLSVLAFLSCELFGMIVRSYVNIKIAQSVNDPSQFEARIKNHRDQMEQFTRRFLPSWVAVSSIAVAFAFAAFATILSALVHGAWLALHH
jgi:hypothetical protein